MTFELEEGKLVVTAHEVWMRMKNPAITLQATTQDIRILGTTLLANGSGVSWSLGLPDGQVAHDVAAEAGIAVE
ncbi:DUF3389 family protein [Parasalinivibrio latis]|uniref:DUF3389 family protein n=1 Tax=Parasalinivibrio latis TaxID=2952610 RepID=UPI0030E53788